MSIDNDDNNNDNNSMMMVIIIMMMIVFMVNFEFPVCNVRNCNFESAEVQISFIANHFAIDLLLKTDIYAHTHRQSVGTYGVSDLNFDSFHTCAHTY